MTWLVVMLFMLGLACVLVDVLVHLAREFHGGEDE